MSVISSQCETQSYYANRHGQTIARSIVSQVFHLLDGYVVHHIDSDNTNNRLDNLAVFASQAEHISFHRGGEGRPPSGSGAKPSPAYPKPPRGGVAVKWKGVGL